MARLAQLTERSSATTVTRMSERERTALLGLQMSRRYHTVLLMLAVYPLLTNTELASILDHSKKTVDRYLEVLEQWGCIQTLTTKYGSSTWMQPSKKASRERWMLSVRGMRYLVMAHHLSLTERLVSMRITKQTPDGRKTKRITWEAGAYERQTDLMHTTSVYHWVSALCEAAHTNAHHQVLWFETGNRCARLYQHEGVRAVLQPDAMMLYRFREKAGRDTHLLLFLECAQGSRDVSELSSKVAAYAQYYRHLKGQPSPISMLLLLIEDDQYQDITTVIRATLGHLPLRVLVARSSQWSAQGVLGSIWHPVLPEPSDRMIRLLEAFHSQQETQIYKESR
jgi:hypothetical protein